MSINFQFVLVPNQAVRLDTARLSHGGPNPVDRQIVGIGSADDPLAVASVVAGTSGYSMQVKVDGGVSGVACEMANDGVLLPIGSLAVNIGYSDGVPVTFTVAYGGNTYIQTLTYTGGNLTGISQWVKQ